MKQLICIVCPKGCRLTVDENNGYKVTGNACERGAAYGYKELTNPTRVLTTTVKIQGGPLPRLPVKSDRDIPKALLRPCVERLAEVTVHAPVRVGDVLLENILDTGANIVATGEML